MSWERARSIPWTHIQHGGDHSDRKKEQTIRQLDKEAKEEALRQGLDTDITGGDLSSQQQLELQLKKENNPSATSLLFQGVPFSTPDLLKNAAFGGCIGSITGAVFGFMDSMRTAGDSQVLKRASNVAKGKYMLQGTSRSAALFGGFFGGFHLVKYGIRVVGDPGQIAEIGAASVITMGGMLAKPSLRPSMPYAGMLITMDAVSIFLREMDKY